jgi:hypothetical protein
MAGLLSPFFDFMIMSKSDLEALLRGSFTRSEREFLLQSRAFRKAMDGWDGQHESFVQIVQMGCELLLKDFVPPPRSEM